MDGVKVKQAIIVRTDLKMGKGKIAGQVAHAAVRAYKGSSFIHQIFWFSGGETKIVLKVGSEADLLSIIEKCKENGIKSYPVHDMGKTQVEADTLTAVGIGPLHDEDINNITAGLKLL